MTKYLFNLKDHPELKAKLDEHDEKNIFLKKQAEDVLDKLQDLMKQGKENHEEKWVYVQTYLAKMDIPWDREKDDCEYNPNGDLYFKDVEKSEKLSDILKNLLK